MTASDASPPVAGAAIAQPRLMGADECDPRLADATTLVSRTSAAGRCLPIAPGLSAGSGSPRSMPRAGGTPRNAHDSEGRALTAPRTGHIYLAGGRG
jgi:hypothetical protein